MIKVLSIRKDQLTEGVTTYWVTIENGSREFRIEIDETRKLRLYYLQDAIDIVDMPAASLIARLVIRHHDGEAISLPQDIEV